jgi:membrane-bound metal-dependent hydrolase YbcI (DUF457 family)
MLGRDHALSGIAAGLAAGEFALHLPLRSTAVLAAYTAGFATLNDLDQAGSCAARSLGFLSALVARIIRKISGGHRHLTHEAVGVATFTGLAWLACAYRADVLGRAGLMLLLALGLAAGMGALRLGGHQADLLAIGAAAAVAWTGWDLPLVPLALALGMSTHIAGDMLTDRGCVVLSPLTKHKFHLLPEPLAFTTGTRPEMVARWVFVSAIAVLAVRAADPAVLAAAVSHIAALA